jgi:response regulator RpfG family c-di-GMP phosphodiesterase
MDSSTINSRIKELTALWEHAHPGSRAHGERVAVYSVATAHKLGLVDNQLLHVRVFAELRHIPEATDGLIQHASVDPRIEMIVELCEKFDQLRTGFGGQGSLSDADVVSWLGHEARAEFDSDLIDALLEVQGIIQPIGT